MNHGRQALYFVIIILATIEAIRRRFKCYDFASFFLGNKKMAAINQQFLKLPQVIVATGKSRSAIYLAIQKGEFPAPIHIGIRAVAWTSDSIVAWQTSCINATAQGGA